MADVAVLDSMPRRRGRMNAGLIGPALLLAPTLIFATVFFIIPMAVMIGYSLSVQEGGVSVFSFSNYVSILGDSYYWGVLWRTIRIGLITTAFALLLSYPAALYLYFSQSKWRRIFLLVVVSPLFISVIVRTYGWIVLLSPNGVVQALLPWDIRLLNTQGAIVLGLVHIYVPFMVLALNASLVKVDKRLLSAAANLGAHNWRIFSDILFPLSIPGVVSGCVIVFSISMTAFSTPVLLGGTANKTMPYLIYQQNLLLANWHMGSALAFFMLFVTLFVVRTITGLAGRTKLHAALK